MVAFAAAFIANAGLRIVWDAHPDKFGRVHFVHFWTFSRFETLAGNPDLGARKHVQNAQKYLWKHDRWPEKGLILALLPFGATVTVCAVIKWPNNAPVGVRQGPLWQ